MGGSRVLSNLTASGDKLFVQSAGDGTAAPVSSAKNQEGRDVQRYQTKVQNNYLNIFMHSYKLHVRNNSLIVKKIFLLMIANTC